MQPINKFNRIFKSRRINYYPCIRKDFIDVLKNVVKELSSKDNYNSLGYVNCGLLENINMVNIVKKNSSVDLKEPLKNISEINDYDKYIKAIREYTMVDILIVQANGLTVDGEILFQDNIGNKISGSVFCAQKVIILVDGKNIYDDIDQFLEQRDGNVFSIIYGSMEGHKERIHLIQIMEKI